MPAQSADAKATDATATPAAGVEQVQPGPKKQKVSDTENESRLKAIEHTQEEQSKQFNAFFNSMGAYVQKVQQQAQARQEEAQQRQEQITQFEQRLTQFEQQLKKFAERLDVVENQHKEVTDAELDAWCVDNIGDVQYSAVNSATGAEKAQPGPEKQKVSDRDLHCTKRQNGQGCIPQGEGRQRNVCQKRARDGRYGGKPMPERVVDENGAAEASEAGTTASAGPKMKAGTPASAGSEMIAGKYVPKSQSTRSLVTPSRDEFKTRSTDPMFDNDTLPRIQGFIKHKTNDEGRLKEDDQFIELAKAAKEDVHELMTYVEWVKEAEGATVQEAEKSEKLPPDYTAKFRNLQECQLVAETLGLNTPCEETITFHPEPAARKNPTQCAGVLNVPNTKGYQAKFSARLKLWGQEKPKSHVLIDSNHQEEMPKAIFRRHMLSLIFGRLGIQPSDVLSLKSSP